MTEETPRLYYHVQALYEQLMLKSTEEDGKRVFEGSMVSAFRAIGVSQSYYTPLYGALKELGSIEVVRAGRGGGAKSRVILHHPPELEPFREVYAQHLTKSTPYAILEQRVENIEGRLPTIDLPSYILNTEQRLEALQNRVEALELREG